MDEKTAVVVMAGLYIALTSALSEEEAHIADDVLLKLSGSSPNPDACDALRLIHATATGEVGGAPAPAQRPARRRFGVIQGGAA
jgi:hypothetical protein